MYPFVDLMVQDLFKNIVVNADYDLCVSENLTCLLVLVKQSVFCTTVMLTFYFSRQKASTAQETYKAAKVSKLICNHLLMRKMCSTTRTMPSVVR